MLAPNGAHEPGDAGNGTRSIRMAAKRDAVAGVVLRPKAKESGNSELVPVKSL